MKLSISKKELRLGLGRMQGLVQTRTSMPILANVLLTASGSGAKSALEIAGTDLEIGIHSHHEGDALKVKSAGSVSVPARKLYDIVRELPNEPIELELRDGVSLALRCGRSRFTLVGADVESHPTIPQFDGGKAPKKPMQFQAPVLSQMIEYTMYASSPDETRYNINGVYLEAIQKTSKLRMVATDGHRLALVERSAGTELGALKSGVIIPRKGLTELKRLVDEEGDEEVELAFEGSNGLARRGGVTLSIRLVEGDFPNYNEVIPKEADNRLTIASEPLLAALRRCVLLADEESNAVKLELEAGLLKISAKNNNQEDANEELDVDYAGKEIAVRFNARYLTEYLAVLATKEVEIGLKQGGDPAKLRPTDDPDTFAIIMPMRV